MVFARFYQIHRQDLLRFVPEDRRAVYNGLRLRVDVDGQGNARISGAFDLNIAELLPIEGAYRVSEDRGAAWPYDGVVTLASPSRGPHLHGDAGAVEIRDGDVLSCHTDGFEPLSILVVRRR